MAADTGWQLDRVIRYAEPPLGERAYVAERAQATYVHSTRGGTTLAEIVLETTEAKGIVWDSHYSNGQWIVKATFDGLEALWNFEPTGNSVHPINDVARSWMGVAPVRSTAVEENSIDESSDKYQIPAATRIDVERQSRPNDTVVIEVAAPIRLVAVPELIPEVESEDATTFTAEAGVVTDEELPLGIDVPEKAAGKKTKRGRAKVPSWDEILFGGPRENP